MLNLDSSAEVTNELSRAAKIGCVWKIRMEYVGVNPATKSKQSRKYWQATGVGYGLVVTSWGRIDRPGQKRRIQFTSIYRKIREKLGKGYRCTLVEAVIPDDQCELDATLTGFDQTDESFAYRRSIALKQ